MILRMKLNVTKVRRQLDTGQHDVPRLGDDRSWSKATPVVKIHFDFFYVPGSKSD